MVDSLTRALAPVLRDLEATGAPVPTVEPSDWQRSVATAESATLWGADGSGRGVWVDTASPAAEQVASVAEQVQEWAVEECAALGRPTNWPWCGEHPANHPLTAAVQDGVALWVCPASGRPACEVGHASGRRRVSMSVVAVDERDSGWEQDLPRFRVYLQGKGQAELGGWTATYDLTGADVLQAVDWAQRRAAEHDMTYAVALVVDDEAEEQRNPGYGRGLVWLVGTDGNGTPDHGSPEWEVQQRMLARRRDPVGIPAADRSPRP